MAEAITYTATVYLDGKERTYTGNGPEEKIARFQAEKKARMFLRRKHLSVKMDNVVKERCEDCPFTTTFTVNDLAVPQRQEIIEDKYDWLLSSSWNL